MRQRRLSSLGLRIRRLRVRRNRPRVADVSVSEPGSPSELRASNRERLTALLRSNGPMTQADLARASGLSPATVSSIARELREDGWLEDYTSQGRGAVLTLSRSAGVAVGIDFGHKHVRVAIA